MSQPKSDIVRGVDEAQAAVAALMKAAGFRKRGRSFNRPADDGLVHVVTFFSTPHHSCSYGTFTVQLGVFIPEIFAFDGNGAPTKFLQDYHCEIRHALGAWSAVNDVAATAAALPDLFNQQVFPFFARFTSRQALFKEWEATGRFMYNEGRSSLVVGVLLHSSGDMAGAADALRQAISVSSDHRLFQEHVRSVAARLSLEL